MHRAVAIATFVALAAGCGSTVPGQAEFAGTTGAPTTAPTTAAPTAPPTSAPPTTSPTTPSSTPPASVASASDSELQHLVCAAVTAHGPAIFGGRPTVTDKPDVGCEVTRYNLTFILQMAPQETVSDVLFNAAFRKFAVAGHPAGQHNEDMAVALYGGYDTPGVVSLYGATPADRAYAVKVLKVVIPAFE